MPPSPKDIQTLFESLKVVRKGSDDDFELRSLEDAKIWGVRMFDDSPSKSTFVIYAGPDARDLACDAADYDAEDDDGADEDEDDEEDGDDEEDKE